ncbi:MAG TPA: addiction module antidote protein, HigA family [Candidatus Angelobacter sp.]|jgi:plasmid maintenance system antidote protein VapI
MAMLLAAFFGTSAEFWMNLQSSYALASVGPKIRKKIKKIKPHAEAAA